MKWDPVCVLPTKVAWAHSPLSNFIAFAESKLNLYLFAESRPLASVLLQWSEGFFSISLAMTARIDVVPLTSDGVDTAPTAGVNTPNATKSTFNAHATMIQKLFLPQAINCAGSAA